MASLLSTKPYKGSRDFYPEEMRQRQWMFGILRKTAESFGFEPYDAPVIEPIDIYLAKTSEEIVNTQIYSFLDRGDRKVAIRPEMTPTVSRMVAAKIRELPKAIKWYSIPNLWRYEKPGKGRLREHWQLNCDIFAAQDEFLADLEILQMSVSLLKNFNASEKMFKVQINHRGILNHVFGEILNIPAKNQAAVARIMDKKAKITSEAFKSSLLELGLIESQINDIYNFLDGGFSYLENHDTASKNEGFLYLKKIIMALNAIGLSNFVEYDPGIVRGFNYYTGMVFEVFDLHPENNRSLFGGGRYDNLVGSFVKESANAVGFGMGDVTLKEFLASHNLLEQTKSKTQIFIVSFDNENTKIKNFILVQKLRQQGFNVELSLSTQKLGKQLQDAEKKGALVAIIQGEDEINNNTFLVKNIQDRSQEEISQEKLMHYLRDLI